MWLVRQLFLVHVFALSCLAASCNGKYHTSVIITPEAYQYRKRSSHVYCYFIAQCPLLPDPENGEVSIEGQLPGDTATYSCNVGYQLNDDTPRICGSNNTWSGVEPTCLGKSICV